MFFGKSPVSAGRAAAGGRSSGKSSTTAHYRLSNDWQSTEPMSFDRLKRVFLLGKAAMRRRWRMQRGAFEAAPRFSGANSARESDGATMGKFQRGPFSFTIRKRMVPFGVLSRRHCGSHRASALKFIRPPARKQPHSPQGALFAANRRLTKRNPPVGGFFARTSLYSTQRIDPHHTKEDAA